MKLFYRIMPVMTLTLMFSAGAQAFSGVEAEVAAREHAWREAWIKGDVTVLESLHAPDYFAINNEGHFTSRAQVLADAKAGLFRYTSMRHENMQIRVYGQTAVVNGLTINKGHRGKRDVSGKFAYTRVYVKDKNVWRAVLAQYTRLQPEPAG